MTQGPWKLIPQIEDWPYASVELPDGRTLCVEEDHETYMLPMEVARLIAAAPELYQALKRVSEEAADDSPEMWAQVAAALRKAEGK